MNLQRTPTSAITYPPLMRIWSALACAVTFTLIAIGTLVTTFRVGMADPVWPTAPWHLLFLDWQESRSGFLIEHTHRIAGYLAGAFILIQTLALWYGSPKRSLRWSALILIVLVASGTATGLRLVRVAPGRSLEALVNPGFFVATAAALALLLVTNIDVQSRAAGRWQRALAAVIYLGVIVQGLLGGLRVYLNELQGPELAVVHGVLAQVVFAVAALLALMTTRGWNALAELRIETPLRRLTAATLVLLFVQIVFGGLLRHLKWPIAYRLHPLLAFAVLFIVTLILVRLFVLSEGTSTLRRTAAVLGLFVAIQALLGVEAWMRHADIELRFQPVGFADATIRSAHVLVGFGIFATAALLAARAWKAKLI